MNRSLNHRIARQFSSTKKKRRKSKPPKPKPSSKSLIKSSKNVHPLAPISKIITSPKVQKQAFNKLVEIQKEVQSVLTPKFMKDRPALADRQKVGPVMDRNWWLWNLALACVPGLSVAAVCKYYESDMVEFYRQQKMLERSKASGVPFSESGVGASGEGGGDDHDADTGVWSRRQTSVWNAAMDLFGFQTNVETGEEGQERNQDLTMDGKDVIQTASTNDRKPVESTKAVQSKPMQMQTSNQEATIKTLVQRIEALENQVKVHNQNDDRQTPRPQLHQSNIKNRRNEVLRKTLDDEKTSNESEPKTIRFDADIAKEGMTHFMKKQSDNLIQRGSAMKRSVLGLFGDDDDIEDLDHPENGTSLSNDDVPEDPPSIEGRSHSRPREENVEEHSGDDRNVIMNSDKATSSRQRWWRRIPLFNTNREETKNDEFQK